MFFYENFLPPLFPQQAVVFLWSELGRPLEIYIVRGKTLIGAITERTDSICSTGLSLFFFFNPRAFPPIIALT